MLGQSEQSPTPNTIIYETDEDGVKIAKMNVILSSSEKITLKFASRFQGKQQLLEKALLVKNYENLYKIVSNIPDTELNELTPQEVDDLNQNNPEGYTLDDFRKMNPDSNLKIEGNPVGVEYTLTFGTGMGKYLTHGNADYNFFQARFYEFKSEGKLQEADANLKEMRKRTHMRGDYHHLTKYAHPAYLAGKPELQRKAIAEIRAFRRLHLWVYADIIAEHERNKGPKKKFQITSNP